MVHSGEAVIPLERLPGLLDASGREDLVVQIVNPPGVALEATSSAIRRGPSGERVLEIALERAFLRNFATGGNIRRAAQAPNMGGLR